MLADSFQYSSSTGIPSFIFSDKIDNIYELSLLETVPEFVYGLISYSRTKDMNEENFSQEYVIALNRCLYRNSKGILAVAEFKDYYTIGANPAKRVDISFVSSEQGASKSKLYTVEAKRLPTVTKDRDKEYVYGFNKKTPSGGIQRFKTGDHGYGLAKSALLGYVEKESFDAWHSKINSWIIDKTKELPLEWKESEQLQTLEIDNNQICSYCRSTAYRKSDSIELFHLWVKIPTE